MNKCLLTLNQHGMAIWAFLGFLQSNWTAFIQHSSGQLDRIKCFTHIHTLVTTLQGAKLFFFFFLIFPEVTSTGIETLTLRSPLEGGLRLKHCGLADCFMLSNNHSIHQLPYQTNEVHSCRCTERFQPFCLVLLVLLFPLWFSSPVCVHYEGISFPAEY